ncbi:MAG TPA: CBS domain-containing protein, partial [Acidobacteriota bacterium]|nr:CBS domain-containing protein [Acidobacteriota bacterium]
PVVDHSGSLMGIVTLQDIRKLKATGGDESSVTVADIMSRDIGQIGEHESALEAFQRISHTPSGRLLVTDPRGSLRGIISKTDLIRAVQVRMVGMDLDEMADFDPVRQ